jgi:protein-S-isoprenylcysteine O-methyltransferase Ste14
VPRPGGGWPLLLAGLWLGASAVRAAVGVDLERPDQLVDSGPYAFSRNPMYVAWTLGYVGVALVAGTAWPLLLLPAVLVLTHVVVKREERCLERRFGAACQSYKPRSAHTCSRGACGPRGGLPSQVRAQGMINEASWAIPEKTRYAL